MPTIDPHTFGQLVLDEMGETPAFTTHPISKSLCMVAAARAYQDFLSGVHVRTMGATAFANSALDWASNRYVAADPAMLSLGWGAGPLRRNFTAACRRAFIAQHGGE